MNRRTSSPPSRRKKGLKVVLVPAMVLGLWAAVSPRLFPAKNVECYTQFGVCPPHLVEGVSWLKGYPLLRPLPERQARQRLQQFPEVSGLDLHRRLPSTVVSAISLRQPVGVVGNSVLGAQTVADEEGNLYPSPGSASLPVLEIDEQAAKSGKISPDQVQALKVLGSLSSLSQTRLSGRVEGKTLFTTLSTGTEIVVDITRPVSDWYGPLQLIQNRSKGASKLPKKVDLRFNSPVIVY